MADTNEDTYKQRFTGASNVYNFSAGGREGDELERLRRLEEITDPATIRRLEEIGVGAGWSCLEVAAGAGSIAAWLGDRVGPGGRVLAVDIDTRFLGDLGAPVEVRELNLLTDDLESGGFDLVHGRAILMHLHDHEVALQRMAAAVKPGGWLLIEEKDLGSQFAFAGHAEADWVNENLRSRARRAGEAGLDVHFGGRVRGLVEGLGFEAVVADGDSHIWRGTEVGARFAELTTSAAHERGAMPDEVHSRLVRLFRDPSFTFTDGV
ncbi:MAG: class I SAM-dependent methyltransferase, partial [Acidimicrobiaceae bacterium]|nr:class I SAM-dependent methyltransferase [Acidimicrobiaceae bacterium]